MKGKICAVKAQGLSQVQYLAMATELTDEVIEKVSSTIHKFVSNGKDKMPKVRMAKSVKEGGANMPVVKDVIAASAMHWIRRTTLNPHQIWAKNIIHDLQCVGGIMMHGQNDDLEVRLMGSKVTY